MSRRVVVTGLGAVTPLGNSVPDTWQAILAGHSGVTRHDFLDASETQTKIAARVKDFDVSLSLSAKEARRLAPFVQFGVEAARQAMEDSGLVLDETMAARAGVAIGAGIGGLGWIEENHAALMQHGSRRISPFFIPGAIVNMVAGLVSMKHNFRGPNLSVVTACTTGLHNIGQSMRMIQHGDADIMLTGGTEMATDVLGIGGFNAVRALSTRNDAPEKASRPFDKDRDGFVLGEGAGVVMLEEYEHAKARGAHIYAEITGFGMSGDAYHMTAPDPSGHGLVASMRNALQDAKMAPDQIQYLNAHGTSTPMLDPLEVTSVKSIFGDACKDLAVSSTKSMTGHLLGAAGSVEVIFSILAIRDQVAPPTINLDDPDPACLGVNLVPHTPQPMKIQHVLSNSFGFGGTNGSVVVSAL